MQQLPASRSSTPQTVKASAKQMFSVQMMKVHGPAGFLMHTVDSLPPSSCVDFLRQYLAPNCLLQVFIERILLRLLKVKFTIQISKMNHQMLDEVVGNCIRKQKPL